MNANVPPIQKEMYTMANTMDGRQQNQPNHQASAKGGPNSPANAGTGNNKQQYSAGGDSRSHNQPNREAQMKDGERSHSGRP
jgi:hypothetical protein